MSIIRSALVQRELISNELNALYTYCEKRGLSDVCRRIKASRQRIERVIPYEEIMYSSKEGVSLGEMLDSGDFLVVGDERIPLPKRGT